MINESSTREITFTVINNETGESTTMTKTFDSGCTWNKISEMYCRFLQSMGYCLDHTDVGAEY